MSNKTPFAEILEAADNLTPEEQEALIDILHGRIVERRRADLAKDLHQARKEFKEGHCKPVTTDDITKEILL